MNIEQLNSFLLWCCVLNYSVLVIWTLMFWLWQDWVYQIHKQLVDISMPTFKAMHYGGMGLYKMLIFVFNLAPLIALQFIR